MPYSCATNVVTPAIFMSHLCDTRVIPWFHSGEYVEPTRSWVEYPKPTPVAEPPISTNEISDSQMSSSTALGVHILRCEPCREILCELWGDNCEEMWPSTVSSPYLELNARPLLTAQPAAQVRRTSRLTSSQAARDGVRAQASGRGESEAKVELRTCRTCKKMYNPLENHPRACRFHTAHFGGETKRKFESVHTGGTMDTIGGGEIVSYWHCCGAADAFDPGCEASPHMSYDE